MKNKSNSQSMVTEAPDRKDPEEEYFRLVYFCSCLNNNYRLFYL